MRGLIVGSLVVGVTVLGVAPGAAAAAGDRAGTWATLTPASAALAPGFPDAVLTSTAGVSVASAATVVGTTPPGLVYGTSAGRTYLSLGTSSSTPVNSVTLTFAGPTPAAGWSVVVGDVDAEDVTISGLVAGGAPLGAADLGTVEPYTTSAAPPTWDGSTLTLVGEGVDTDGAAAWFSPTVPLTSLTFTATRRLGTPAVQIWLVGLTASLAGTVTDGGGTPVPGAAVELRAPGGGALPGATAPVIAAADGTFEFPAVVPTAVEVVATAPGGVPGTPVAVPPVDGAFPVPVVVTATPVVVTPAAPTLPPTGTAVHPAAATALAVLAAGAGALALGARRRVRTKLDG